MSLQTTSTPLPPLPEMQVHRRGLRRARAQLRSAGRGALQVIRTVMRWWSVERWLTLLLFLLLSIVGVFIIVTSTSESTLAERKLGPGAVCSDRGTVCVFQGKRFECVVHGDRVECAEIRTNVTP